MGFNESVGTSFCVLVVLLSVTFRSSNSDEVSPPKRRTTRIATPFSPDYYDSSDTTFLPCIPRDFGKGSVVCVCNSTYCDTVSLSLPHESANPGGIIIPSRVSRSLETIISASPSSSWNSGSVAAAAAAQTFDEVESNGASPQGPGPDSRGQVQIFTSTKTGSRLHKSIVHFNNGPEEPYRRDDLLSSHDDLVVRAREAAHRTSSAPSQQSLFSSIDSTNFAAGPDPIIPNHLNPLDFLGDFPRPDKLTRFTIQRDVQYQKVLGYGGAFTDAAGINIGMLSQPTQENLMKSYFGKTGIDYSMGRVPIGGTDFSTRAYTYDDEVEELGGVDANLTRFALQPEDFKLKIPYIHWAQSLSGNNVKLLASPWSAPGWMKTSGQIHGKGQLKREFYQQWADYFVRFLQDYKKENVDIWGITTGNEPFNGFVPFWPFNCMGWRAADMRKFLANNLGPTLASSGFSPQVVMLDDNKGSVATWAREILAQNDSAQYVHGVGTHWYLDFLTSPDVLSRFHNNYPDYFIVQTEACLGFTPWEMEKVSLGNWERGETYLEAIIQDSRNFVGAWIDWNLALDTKGGPNWAKLAADAAILVNPSEDEFFKQPIYYGIGHVSKFVPPDSVRIELTMDSYSPRGLKAVAFLRPDNGTVIVILNKLRYDAKVAIRDEGRGLMHINIPQQSFQTLVYW